MDLHYFQITGQPLISHVTRGLQLTGAVEVGPPDGVDGIVRPVHVAVYGVVVDGDGVADVVQGQHDVRVVRRVEGNPAEVCPPCQQQDLVCS